MGAGSWQNRVSSFYVAYLQLGKYCQSKLSYLLPQVKSFAIVIIPCKVIVHGRSAWYTIRGKSRINAHGVSNSFCPSKQFLFCHKLWGPFGACLLLKTMLWSKLHEALFILASEILIQSLTIFRPLILTFFLNTILISLRLLVLVEIVAKCSW